MARDNEPRIVAELGRPETPEETAARKAASSRKHRINQTGINLVLSIGASLAIVLFIVLVVVRPDQPPREAVDYAVVAEQSQGQIDAPLAAPILPPEWSANDARLEKNAGILTWYIGFITPSNQFVALSQGIEANPTWLAAVLRDGVATGTDTIDGIEWDVYDRRDTKNPGNLAFAMATTVDGTSYVLFGTGSDEEFRTLAASLSAEIGE